MLEVAILATEIAIFNDQHEFNAILRITPSVKWQFENDLLELG